MSKSFVVTALKQGLTPNSFIREQYPIWTSDIRQARYNVSERLKKYGDFYIVSVKAA